MAEEPDPTEVQLQCPYARAKLLLSTATQPSELLGRQVIKKKKKEREKKKERKRKKERKQEKTEGRVS